MSCHRHVFSQRHLFLLNCFSKKISEVDITFLLGCFVFFILMISFPSWGLFVTCCAVLCLATQSCLFATPWTGGRQAPLTMGILQARITERVVMPSSKVSSQPRDRTQGLLHWGGFFTVWATREALFLYIPLKLQIFIDSHFSDIPYLSDIPQPLIKFATEPET